MSGIFSSLEGKVCLPTNMRAFPFWITTESILNSWSRVFFSSRPSLKHLLFTSFEISVTATLCHKPSEVNAIGWKLMPSALNWAPTDLSFFSCAIWTIFLGSDTALSTKSDRREFIPVMSYAAAAPASP